MRYLYAFLLSILIISCASSPTISTGQERQVGFVYISFFNYSIEDITLHITESGKSETAIGTINRDENGQLRRIDSLIPSGRSASFIIQPGYYTIVPKTRDGGQNADFNPYEEFYFPPSAEEYVIHLDPQHRRITTTSITLQENSAPRLPLFDIRFRDEMIRPITEEHIELIGEDNKSVDVDIEWHNSRWVSIRPKEALLASARYKVIVGLGARNTESERIMEAVEISYATGNVVDNISSFDLTSVKFDTSIPGYVRLDWNLPFGAHGSEIHISGGVIEDLQAKTNYTFSIGTDPISYKILPYRISPNGRKEYNQTDLERPLSNIPQLFMAGVSISHTIVTNTAYRQEFRINLHSNDIPIGDISPKLEFALRNSISGNDLAKLNAGNNFTYITDSPWHRADSEITYSVIGEDAVLYSFNVRSPPAAELQAAADQRQKIDQAAADQAAAAERSRQWQNFLEFLVSEEFWLAEGTKFGSIGLNVGTSFATPLLIVNLNITIPIFPYTFIEGGADIGLFHAKAKDEIREVEYYYSLYYYGRFNLYLPFNKLRYSYQQPGSGWYLGIGGGYMDVRFKFNFPFTETTIKIPTFDVATGFFLGKGHSYFRLGYALRTNFSDYFNQRITLGYTWRIYFY